MACPNHFFGGVAPPVEKGQVLLLIVCFLLQGAWTPRQLCKLKAVHPGLLRVTLDARG